MSKTVIVGTAGHIDHGKSSLVRALTGTDPDRLKEEKERGITIELGFAHLTLPSGTLAGIVDVPGHERFVRAMVAGAAGVDIVMLVIAADEGIKPQTREHLDICRLLSVRRGLIVLNKCDLVDDEWAELQEEEVRALVAGTFLDGAPIVRVSSTTKAGLPELVATLDRFASEIPGKDPANLFRLPVDRSFVMKGFGTVVTGTIVGGTVKVGDEVALLPGALTAKVRGLQVHGGSAEKSSAGTRTAVNLQGLEREEAPRGSVLCKPATFRETHRADVVFEYLPITTKPLKTRAKITFHAGTMSTEGKLLLYGATEVAPGGTAHGQVVLDEPAVLGGGDRFILRGFSQLANFGYTIGGGRVLHPFPSERKGMSKGVPPFLAGLASENVVDRIVATLDEAGMRGLPPVDLAVVAGTGMVAVNAELSKLSGAGKVRKDPASGRYFSAAAAEGVREALVSAVGTLHDRNPERSGFPRDEVFGLLPPGIDPALPPLVLPKTEGLATEGELYYVPGRRPRGVELSSPQAKAIAAKIAAAGLTALSRNELAEALAGKDEKSFDRTLDGMAKAGAIVKVREFSFDPAAIAALEAKLVAHLKEKGSIDLAGFREMTGLTRKYLVDLLEHFDSVKLTIRVGDTRVLRQR